MGRTAHRVELGAHEARSGELGAHEARSGEPGAALRGGLLMVPPQAPARGWGQAKWTISPMITPSTARAATMGTMTRRATARAATHGQASDIGISGACGVGGGA